MSRPFFRDLPEPSLVAWEGSACDVCHSETMPGEHVFNIAIDPFADGGGEFVRCCSEKCINHAIEDDGANVRACRGK